MTGTQLKLKGMAQAASKHSGMLHTVQGVARGLAAHGRVISSDDVRAFMCGNGWTDLELSKALGNAAGLIFDGPDWVPVGWTKSTRPAAHGRAVRTWRIDR